MTGYWRWPRSCRTGTGRELAPSGCIGPKRGEGSRPGVRDGSAGAEPCRQPGRRRRPGPHGGDAEARGAKEDTVARLAVRRRCRETPFQGRLLRRRPILLRRKVLRRDSPGHRGRPVLRRGGRLVLYDFSSPRAYMPPSSRSTSTGSSGYSAPSCGSSTPTRRSPMKCFLP